MFSFFHMCQYTLVQMDNVVVTSQNIPCGPAGIICARKLDVTVGFLKIELARDIDLKVGGIVKPGGYYMYVFSVHCLYFFTTYILSSLSNNFAML